MTAGARRDKLEAQLRILDEARRLIEQQLAAADRPAHARDDRPRLRLIRGGRALVLAPVLWGWAQVREHATASAGIAAAGVLAVPTTLGVGVAGPEVYPGVQDRRPVDAAVIVDEEQQALRPPQLPPSPRPASSPAPLPSATVDTAEAVEPGGSSPDPSTPVSAPTPIPTPTPTLPVDEVIDPVEEVVWTKTTALVHCRDVLEVLPTDLQDCVRELLAG